MYHVPVSDCSWTGLMSTESGYLEGGGSGRPESTVEPPVMELIKWNICGPWCPIDNLNDMSKSNFHIQKLLWQTLRTKGIFK